MSLTVQKSPPWLVIGEALVANKGQWVSGEELAKKTGLSRTAIWKWINNLEQAGISIEREQGKGYRLNSVFDLLHPAIFLPQLAEAGEDLSHLLAPDHYHYFDIVDSTNTLCARMAREGAPEGTLVVAEGQTKGKGRSGRSWYSPHRASLYLSLLLRPKKGLMEAQRLTMVASVALAETVREVCKIEAKIKWPNDLFVSSRKVAGILVEAESQGGSLSWMVLGIGLNVNTERFPGELTHRATSLYVETGKRWCRAELLIQLLLKTRTLYRQWQRGNTEEIFSKWREMSYTLGRRVKTEQGFTGYAEEVTPQGGLVIRGDSGDRLVVNAGDVDVIQEP